MRQQAVDVPIQRGWQTRQHIGQPSVGSWPWALAVAKRLMIAAAPLPAVSEAANNPFFRPRAIGRIAFSTGFLSIG